MLDERDTGNKKLFSQWSTLFTFVTKLFPKSVLLYHRCPSSGHLLFPLPCSAASTLVSHSWRPTPHPKSTLCETAQMSSPRWYLRHCAEKNLSLSPHWPPGKHPECLKLWHHTLRIKNKYWHTASTQKRVFFMPLSLETSWCSMICFKCFSPFLYSESPFPQGAHSVSSLRHSLLLWEGAFMEF